MDKTAGSEQFQATQYVGVAEMASMIPLSKSFLDKDATGPKRIPFIRLGDRRLYHPPTVFEALKAYEVGGPASTRGGRPRRA